MQMDMNAPDPRVVNRLRSLLFKHADEHERISVIIETVRFVSVSSIWKIFPDIYEHFDERDHQNIYSLTDNESFLEGFEQGGSQIITVDAAKIDVEAKTDEKGLTIISTERFQQFENWLSALPKDVLIDLEN